MTDDLVYEVKELPPLMKISIASVKRLIRRGQLPSVKVAGRRLVRGDDLRAYIAGLPVKGAS